MKSLLFFSTICVLFGCNNVDESSHDIKMANYKSQDDGTYTSSSENYSSAIAEKSVNIPKQVALRKIIWNGAIEMQVKNVDEATSQISEIIQLNGGFISDMQTTNDAYNKANSITIRINKEKFQPIIASLKKQGSYIKSVSINSQDVTEEYVDIESRLKTKREVRERYIQVLRNKAGSVKDIIEAEEAIRTITEEIEVQEGRMRYLNDKIDLSTIIVDIYQKVKQVDEPSIYEESYASEVSSSFSIGWKAIQVFILVLVTIWPLILVISIVLFWKRKWIRTLFK